MVIASTTTPSARPISVSLPPSTASNFQIGMASIIRSTSMNQFVAFLGIHPHAHLHEHSNNTPVSCHVVFNATQTSRDPGAQSLSSLHTPTWYLVVVFCACALSPLMLAVIRHCTKESEGSIESRFIICQEPKYRFLLLTSVSERGRAPTQWTAVKITRSKCGTAAHAVRWAVLHPESAGIFEKMAITTWISQWWTDVKVSGCTVLTGEVATIHVSMRTPSCMSVKCYLL